MVSTIQCDQCGVVLNLPPQAAGKRMKCPKCGNKFQVGANPAPLPASEKSDHDASPASSQDIPRGHSDLSLPVSSGDLRDTFDLPLLTEAASGRSSAAATKPQAADALALFEEKKPAPRRPNAAEARAKARRCPTCGGVVPAGMSLCSSCGLDLESGTRVLLDEDMMPAAPVQAKGAPIPVTVIGLVSFLGSLILTIYSTYKWQAGMPGALWFVPVCLFGAFAAFQLLRGHTPKLLIAALTLGVMIDVVALIAMPVFQANEETRIANEKSITENSDGEIVIQPITERLDVNKLSTGIALVLLYAAVSVYLASPGVRRHYSR